jgi:isoaspartyl peptidase/L-asparaginase-like protein (Ntn-hydrolase superfamily)
MHSEHRRELGLPDYDEVHPSEMFDGLDITLDGQPPAFNAGVQPPHYTSRLPSSANSTHSDSPAKNQGPLPKGTVGAVALDQYGVIACATSTGGKNNKLPGRLGDSAAPGAGSWAETWTDSRASSSNVAAAKTQSKSLLARVASLCGSSNDVEELDASTSTQPARRGVGLSCTGDGDVFLKVSAGALVAHRARFLGESVETAAGAMIAEFEALGGEGGVIALDEKGTPSFM